MGFEIKRSIIGIDPRRYEDAEGWFIFTYGGNYIDELVPTISPDAREIDRNRFDMIRDFVRNFGIDGTQVCAIEDGGEAYWLLQVEDGAFVELVATEQDVFRQLSGGKAVSGIRSSESYRLGYDEGFASADDWLAEHEADLREHGWVKAGAPGTQPVLDTVEYAAFILGYDLLNRDLEEGKYTYWDEAYLACIKLASEFMASEQHADLTVGFGTALGEWVGENHDMIRSRLSRGLDNNYLDEFSSIEQALGASYRSIALEDARGPHGGKGHSDETLGEFLDEIGLDGNSHYYKLRRACMECGIVTPLPQEFQPGKPKIALEDLSPELIYQAYRKQEALFRLEDARTYVGEYVEQNSDLASYALDDEDCTRIAERFMNHYDCTVDEQAQWEYAVAVYIAEHPELAHLQEHLVITPEDALDLEPEELAEMMAAQDEWYAAHPDAARRDGKEPIAPARGEGKGKGK